MTGIGASGRAVQRVVRTFDPHAKSLDCLRSSVAAGGNVSLTGAVLRATNSGLISANTTSITSSTVYGKVQATSISGSTYSGTTTTNRRRRPARHARLVDRLQLLPHERHANQTSTA